MARRHYSDEVRAGVLAVLDANGGNATRAAREAGVPLSTLREWRDDRDRAAPAELRTQTRETLADVYGRVAAKAAALLDGALGELTAEDVAGNPKLMTAVNTVGGTAADKERMARDQPTEHVKHRVEVVVIREDRPIRASD